MTSSIEAVRAALAAGPTPTPGPWRWERIDPEDHSWTASEIWSAANNYEGEMVATHVCNDVDAAYIAACNPSAIAELLAQLDAALSRASEVEARVRDECAEFLLNNYQDYATIAALCAAIRSMRPTGDIGVQS